MLKLSKHNQRYRRPVSLRRETTCPLPLIPNELVLLHKMLEFSPKETVRKYIYMEERRTEI